MLDGDVLDHVSELWDKCSLMQQCLESMPMAEGLKPLRHFSSLDELLAMGGATLLNALSDYNQAIRDAMNATMPYLRPDGSCKSLNFTMQPVIGVVYGPTGCGKSQLLRNLMSTGLIQPPPETVFFIVPQVDMIPPQELLAWETQICEGNYTPGPTGTLIPQSSTLKPAFKIMSYDDLTMDYNYDVAHPHNVFAQAAKTGPIAIIMDECMEDLGRHKAISKFFHAFPSKLHDKFPKCTGYSVFVVLHNMNPRKDLGGNIANLKIQAKLHLISPRMHPSQLNRFINTYTKSLPLPITLLLKDIFSFHAQHSQYDWIIYNTLPPHESLQWLYLNPSEGLMPMYLNIHAMVYEALLRMHKTLIDRARWTRYYHRKNKDFY
ncbi:IVa2 [Bovine adenovirus 3]|uniref:IVa2 n=1 Tax=Bovine adenovirus B serotype 3 TaxID=10510 RepID=A0A9W3INE5_ADEB3|nr:IVa2 [Bovine adenovirus 3]